MKKSIGLMLAAVFAMGVLAVARPAAADEEPVTIDGVTVYAPDGTVTSYEDENGTTIVDVDWGDGTGVTINTDTGDIQDWEQDEDGEWYPVEPADPNEPIVLGEE